MGQPMSKKDFIQANSIAFNETPKYRLYATGDNGEGRVLALGDYYDPTEIEIIVGMFADDVIISIGEVND